MVLQADPESSDPGHLPGVAAAFRQLSLEKQLMLDQHLLYVSCH